MLPSEVIAKLVSSQESHLVSLDLSHNKLGDRSSSSLLQSLFSSSTLTSLNMRNNGMASATATELAAEAIGASKALLVADLSRNTLSDTFARRLGDALSLPHVGVTSLDLSEASIGDQGVAAIAMGLLTNESLTRLDISRNRFSDRGAEV